MHQTPATQQSEPWRIGKIKGNLNDVKQLLRPDDTFLDVGCGQGYAYDFLQCNYTGIDYYQEEIDAARKRLPGVNFMVGDVFDLKGSYDVVFCSRLLVHLPNFDKAMESLKRVAKRHCVITVKIGPDREEHFGDHYFRWFSEETLKSAGDCKIIRHMKYSTIIYDR